MFQREITTKEAFQKLFTIAYMVVAFPLLLLFGSMMFSMTMGARTNHRFEGDVLVTAIIWAVILFSVAKLFYGRSRRRTQLKRIVGDLQDPAYFEPTEGYFDYRVSAGKYLGIDLQHGTILYVHRIRKGQVDVVAMTMDDWTNREIESSILRLYTKLPELPRIEFDTPCAQRWYDTLGAMEHKQFSTAASFKQHVRGRLDELEREHSVQIPRLA